MPKNGKNVWRRNLAEKRQEKDKLNMDGFVALTPKGESVFSRLNSVNQPGMEGLASDDDCWTEDYLGEIKEQIQNKGSVTVDSVVREYGTQSYYPSPMEGLTQGEEVLFYVRGELDTGIDLRKSPGFQALLAPTTFSDEEISENILESHKIINRLIEEGLITIVA